MEPNLLLILIVVWVLLIWRWIAIYNNVISAKNNIDEAESAIDVMLKNRYDVLPNLVATVKQYMKHEADTLANLTDKRAQVMSWSMAEKAAADAQLKSASMNILAVAENYPDLKADSTFINLQKEIVMLENSLQAARRTYNAAVKRMNDLNEQIPSRFFTGGVDMSKYPYFEATLQEKEMVDVDALFEK